MQCGFSLTQIGEFAFIIASLGVSLNVTSDFLYPIVVAVSVITTFLTPYMIRLSVPAYNFVDKRMPPKWRNLIDRYSGSTQPANYQSNWKALITAIIRITVVYSVLSIAAIFISFSFIVPLLVETLGDTWGNWAGAVITIIIIAPFLRAMIMKKNHSIEFKALWNDSRFNHAPLISVIILRILIGVFFVIYVIKHIFQASVAIMVGVAIVIVLVMIFSRFLKRQSILMERTFLQNMRSKDMFMVYRGAKKPEYAGSLLDRDIHLTDIKISPDSLWAGLTLMELNLGKRFGVHVVSIIRGTHRINIPGGQTRIFPGDTIQVIGSDSQLSDFAEHAEAVSEGCVDDDFEKKEMLLKQFEVNDGSKFVGKTIRESGIRNKYHCLVVGIENSNDVTLHAPDVDTPLNVGDIVWVVGEETALRKLFEE